MSMADRATLHKMVDQLPEEALDAAFRVLENYERHPPKERADRSQMLMEAKGRFKKQHEENLRRVAGRFPQGYMGGGSRGPDGSARTSIGRWDGLTNVTVSVNTFRGHEFHIEERISLSDDRRTLLYTVEVKLPEGEAERHDFSFNVGDAGRK
jgi:hypothetical protein